MITTMMPETTITTRNIALNKIETKYSLIPFNQFLPYACKKNKKNINHHMAVTTAPKARTTAIAPL